MGKEKPLVGGLGKVLRQDFLGVGVLGSSRDMQSGIIWIIGLNEFVQETKKGGLTGNLSLTHLTDLSGPLASQAFPSYL